MNLQPINFYNKEDKLIVAVDCIIFGFDGEQLKILLIKRDFEPKRGEWSLVGGFLKRDETLSDAAERILKTYTGLDDIFMEQVFTFSEVDRDPGERTISTAYYALINIENHNNKLNHQFGAQWFDVNHRPKLIFDHDRMVESATHRLQSRASTKPIGFELLPEKFTMKQLQKLYESIWNTELDKRNFINKIQSFDILKKLKEKDKTSSRKGSFYYQFDPDKYEEKKKDTFLLKF